MGGNWRILENHSDRCDNLDHHRFRFTAILISNFLIGLHIYLTTTDIKFFVLFAEI